MLETNYGPRIDYQLCTGCGECYECCPMDVFGWDAETKRPTLAYLAECRICCVCETVCPEIAIDVEIPLHARIDFGIYPKRATK
jgi:NAD-dependent dihydropyrimidine dehydrogenase PreA subunit